MKNKALVKVIEPKKKGRSLAPQIEHILMELGEDVTREGLIRTPERADKALRFLTSGYSMNLDGIINGALFDVEYDEMVLVRDIEFYSMCEHHMLPFFGK
ncbi:MAG: GTP cyclohydrolase I, partial [Bryobacterales bacterium]|nr:GTP cyclohydrolase I [Bryobacterales bacterium]